MSSAIKAQDYTGDIGAMAIDAGMYGAIVDSINNSASQTLESRNETRVSTPKSLKSLDYQISNSRRTANLAQFVEKTRSVDPVGAAKMEQVFAESDIIADIGQGIAQYGLRIDNAADAYTLYWITAWQAANGDESDPIQSQVSGVQAQAANALLDTPEFVAASDAVKQEMSEAYLLQAVMIDQYMDFAKANPEMKMRIAEAVRQGAKASGLDLDTMMLTDSGFESR